MLVHLGADYLGYERARTLEAWLAEAGYEVRWHGAPEYDHEDDYPVYSIRVGHAVVQDEDNTVMSKGVVVGGTGSAETIVANKVRGGRAVAGVSVSAVTDARQHADANILVLGATEQSLEQSQALITAFLNTNFLNILDDARRVINTAEFENSGTIEGWLIDEAEGN